MYKCIQTFIASTGQNFRYGEKVNFWDYIELLDNERVNFIPLEPEPPMDFCIF